MPNFSGVWTLKEHGVAVKGDRWQALPARGLFAGGYDGSARVNVIDFVIIDTTGNASDFGDLSADKKDITGLSSSTRGIFSGGQIP